LDGLLRPAGSIQFTAYLAGNTPRAEAGHDTIPADCALDAKHQANFCAHWCNACHKHCATTFSQSVGQQSRVAGETERSTHARLAVVSASANFGVPVAVSGCHNRVASM